MIREKKVFIFKIHDIWFERSEYEKSRQPIVCLHSNQKLESKTYDLKLTAYTFLMNINIPLDEILKKFDYKSARYPINKAIRDGVEVKKAVTKDEIDRFFRFQKSFCKEKEIPVCAYEELEEMDCYYAVSAEGEYLGGCAFLISKEESLARYKYGATLHKLNANEIILWRAMCDYHEAGLTYFDMGGVIPTEDTECYYYRHYQFKKKFGGELIESYCYFKIRGVYRLFCEIFKLILKIFFKGDLNGFTNFLNKIHVIH